MKKSMQVMIPIIIIVFVSMICGGCYYAFYSGISKNSPYTENQNANITFKNEEYPRIMATYSMENLVDKIRENLTGSFQDEQCGSENEIIDKLINNEIDIAIVPELTNEQREKLVSSGKTFESFTLTKDALVFMTSASNSLDNLMSSDLVKIYSGEIENWSSLGGKDLEIKAYQKSKGSYIQSLVESKLMKNTKMKDPVKENLIGDEIAIGNLTSEYYNEEGRIGYTLYNYYKLMYNNQNEGVYNPDKLLSVDSISPTKENMLNNSYPYTITYYIIINSSNPQGNNVRKWIGTMLSEKGKNIIKEAGYIAN